MSAELGIAVPLPQFRQHIVGVFNQQLEENGMIPRDLASYLENNEAVVAYGSSGQPVGFMARTHEFPSVTIPEGKTVELGAMIKIGTDVNGVGIAMTRVLVGIEHEFHLSDEQIAMATTPQSIGSFHRAGGVEMPADQIPQEAYGECRRCSHFEAVAASGRRCCATVFNLTNIV